MVAICISVKGYAIINDKHFISVIFFMVMLHDEQQLSKFSL